MAALANRNRRNVVAHVLDALENAKKESKVVVLYVYTQSDERRMARAVEACAQFEQNVLNTLLVAQELQECTCVRVAYESLTDEMRREYGLLSSAPQIVVYDFTGRRLHRGSASESAANLANRLKAAKEHNQREWAKANR